LRSQSRSTGPRCPVSPSGRCAPVWSSAAGFTPDGGAVHLATLFLLDFYSLASFAELGFVCGKYRNRPYAILERTRKKGQPRLADVEDIDLRGGEPACGLEAPCIGGGTGELAREGGGRARPRQEARRSRTHSRQEARWAHRPSCGAARVCDRRWTWLGAVTSWSLAAFVPFLF